MFAQHEEMGHCTITMSLSFSCIVYPCHARISLQQSRLLLAFAIWIAHCLSVARQARAHMHIYIIHQAQDAPITRSDARTACQALSLSRDHGPARVPHVCAFMPARRTDACCTCLLHMYPSVLSISSAHHVSIPDYSILHIATSRY